MRCSALFFTTVFLNLGLLAATPGFVRGVVVDVSFLNDHPSFGGNVTHTLDLSHNKLGSEDCPELLAIDAGFLGTFTYNEQGSGLS